MIDTPLLQVRNVGPVFYVVQRAGRGWQQLSGHYQSRSGAEQFITRISNALFFRIR